MKIIIKSENERQEMLRALRLLKQYPLPGTADMDEIEKQLKEHQETIKEALE